VKKQKSKLCIIHFLPLEAYPPVMNLVDYLADIQHIELAVVSNHIEKKKNLSEYVAKNDQVKIFRPGKTHQSAILRYWNYFKFYLGTLFFIVRYAPEHILYVETLSSWPALIYKKLKGKKVNLLVHYHEYATPNEYATRMLLSKWMHKIELNMYKQFSWISQTNPVRMGMFRNDYPEVFSNINPEVFQIMPNYPPRSWEDISKTGLLDKRPVKLVYVGSLGLKNMYLEEVVNWLKNYQQDFTLDIYAHNINEEAKSFLDAADAPNVKYCGGCTYQLLPGVLKKYDVGIVIYKPFSLNTVNAVSNKVFEYVACGLDVWFSTDMTFTFEYTKLNAYPKIIPVDFSKLDQFDFKAALSREGISYEPSLYYCENIYQHLVSKLNIE
jgi:hypothetical protein